MRVRETVIRPFGNSAGVTLPKDVLEHFGLEKGSKVFVRETPDGILLSPYDPDFGAVMDIAADIGQRYQNAMRELSKR